MTDSPKGRCLDFMEYAGGLAFPNLVILSTGYLGPGPNSFFVDPSLRPMENWGFLYLVKS